MDSTNPSDAPQQLEELVDEYLGSLGGDDPPPIEDWRERAGGQWEDFRASVEVALSLGAAGDLLSNYEVTMTVPEKIERFEIVRQVAEGGFSRVFLGFDPKLKRSVALKVLKSSGAREALHSESLEREAHALAQVTNDHVVGILELIDNFESGIIVTEFIPGPTLERVIAWLSDPSAAAEPESEAEKAERAELVEVAKSLADPNARARMMLRVADGLTACHAKDVLHRDLKPSNVLVPTASRPKLIDFGLAHADTKLQLAGFTESFAGTAAYLSPEQIDERRVGKSVASEIYSLGVMVYEVVTLEHPWGYGIQREAMTPPAHPLLSREMKWVLDKALCIRPEDRYGSVANFAMDLRRVLDHDPNIEAAPSLLRRGVQGIAAKVPFGLRSALLGAVVILGLARQTVEYKNRAAIQDKTVSISALIDGIDSPSAATTVLDRLAPLKASSYRADNDWIFRWALPPLGPDVAELKARTGARLEELVAAETVLAMNTPKLAARQSSIDEIQSKWSGPIASALGPARVASCLLRVDPSIVVRYVKNGRELSSEVMDHREPLRPGHYRAHSAQTGYECSFEVISNQLVAAPELRPIPEVLARQLVAVPDSDRPDVPGPFEILREDILDPALPGWLSKADLKSHVEATNEDYGGHEDPNALLVSAFFCEFAATRAGMRLPTYGELLAAHENGLLGLDQSPLDSVTYWSSETEDNRRYGVQVTFQRVNGEWPESEMDRTVPRRGPLKRGGRLRFVRTVIPTDQ